MLKEKKRFICQDSQKQSFESVYFVLFKSIHFWLYLHVPSALSNISEAPLVTPPLFQP